ncbi:MAG TPA: hypothetical protein VLZ04_06275, partial [Gaiellaceae bacterium]|nr:hypothetical protein [Gaiellaceae bacterium]
MEKSDAKLFRLTAEDQIGDADAGESIVGGPRDVGAEIQEIIGLTKEQFLQTIVLPQGEFARFLTTRPDDRRTLLQSIFATRVYQNTQEALRERAREARGRVEEARRTVGTAVQNLWGEREDVPEIGSATWIDSSVLREAAAALVAGVRAEAARVEAEAQRAADVACQAQGRLDSARALEKLLARQASALAVLRDIEERAESIATDRERLERAKTATGLRSLFGNADSAARAAAGAAEAVARARAVARAEVRALDDAQLAGRRDALNTSAEGLRSSLKHEDAVREFEASLVRLGRDSAREVAALDSKKTARAGLPGQREALSDRQSAARTAEARLPWHKQRVAELERVAKRLARIARLDGELTNARTAAAAAKSAADDALAWETAAREGWFNGLAGELAGQLTADEPCLVCGSLSHPAPARRPEDAVSKAEMQRAGKERVAADEVASTALQKVARLAAQQGELRSQMGDQDVEAIASDLTAARGARAEDVAAAAS